MATKDQLVARAMASEADRNEVFLESQELREETFREWLEGKDITVPDDNTMSIINAKLNAHESEIDELQVHNHDNQYANIVSEHAHSNKETLDGITSDKVVEWNNKSDFSGSYNDLTNKPTIPSKVSELQNDSNFTPVGHKHDDLYAKASSEHTHDNKGVLDTITINRTESWDSKSEFSGKYEDLQNKPTIPSTVSQLQNDSDFASKAYVNSQIEYVNENEKHVSPLISKPIDMAETNVSPADAVNVFHFDLYCHVPQEKDFANFQGLSMVNGYFYVGEQSRENTSISYIHKMSMGGNIVETKQQTFGHIAGLSYRVSDGYFYITEGSINDEGLKIYVYDYVNNTTIKMMNFTSTGLHGIVAVDNKTERLYVLGHGTSYTDLKTMLVINPDTEEIERQFTVPITAVPQGMECYDGNIYILTGTDGTKGTIHVLNKDGRIIQENQIYKELHPNRQTTGGIASEPQGMVISSLYGCPVFFMLWANPMRIYAHHTHESSMFRNISLMGQASSQTAIGAALIPVFITYRVFWDKTKQRLIFKDNVDSAMESQRNFFHEPYLQVSADDGKYENILTLRTSVKTAMAWGCELTAKMKGQGWDVASNPFFDGTAIRIRILYEGKIVTDLSTIPDGLEVNGWVLAGIRLSR